MKINQKYRLATVEGLVFLALYLIKVLIFNKLIDNQSFNFILGLISTGYIVLVISIANTLSSNKRSLIVLITYSLISIIMLVDTVYYTYFNQLPSIVVIKQISQLGAVGESVGYVLKPINMLMIIDIIPIWIYYYLRRKKLIFKDSNYSFKLDIQRRFVIMGAVAILLLSSVVIIDDFNKDINLSMQEFFTYHINDIYVSAFEDNDIDDIDELFNEYRHKLSKESRLNGIAKNRNVITIQVEGLQNFVINNYYEGQEITPNLNKLIEKDSIYYTRYYQQLGRGNTSDAEFVTHNSLYPAMDGQTYLMYFDNTYYGLPWILKENGYSTKALHGYKGSFWNRDKAYSYQGFDSFISESDYTIGEAIGLGLNDKDFFIQSLPHLKEMQSPFYAFLVTLTSHHPFEMPEKYQKIELKDEHKDTLFGNYIQSIHYTDEAIGQFIQDLKEQGLYENTIISIYGDHFGLSSTDEDNKRIMTEYLGYEYDFDEMMRIPLIIHIPGTEVKEQNSIVGGQIDFLPTILNLLDIQNKKGVMFGQDLNNVIDGFVAQQTYMLKGSYINNDVIYSMSRDGIFEHSRAWNIDTREQVDLKDCRNDYEKAIDQINKSNYILSNDILDKYVKNKNITDKKDEGRRRVKPEIYISHAGGRVEGLSYTNSKEALAKSYNNGFKLIELDMEWTSDNSLALIHDWKGYVEQAFSVEQKRYSTDEFKNFNMIKNLTQMTIEDLVEWLRQHKDAYIVTDIKKDNVDALELIKERYPDVVDQFIPQIYSMDQYIPVQGMGYKNIILTLYMSNYTDEEILDFVKRQNIFAVTMPIDRAKTELPRKLNKENVFVYAHTINDKELKQELEKNEVNGFYTDDLVPEKNKSY
ncbi:sulfatase-like hydrolase/transferase [Brassicibacter mesophilus]|uniref:sulfatase-like hydrolase/transferase n=1 Tax=Brassicibacter mesophilus TaxID=745119 RepID=UPI003D20507D